MPSFELKPRQARLSLDWGMGVGIFIVLSVAYLMLAQEALTYDGAVMIHLAMLEGVEAMPHHPLFLPLFKVFLDLGKSAGVNWPTAGVIQSALGMAAAAAVLFASLRQLGVIRGLALTYAILLGISAPALENGTTVELYGMTMLMVVLNFRAFSAVARAETRRHQLGLWLTAVLVVAFHVGYAFWVLAVYLALGIRREFSWVRFLGYLAQGGGVVLVYGLILGLQRQAHGETLFIFKKFFHTFWIGEPTLYSIWLPIKAPLTDFAAFAGLITFPAPLGWMMWRGRYPAHARVVAWGLPIFVLYYSYWTVDWGCFYLPLLLPVGLFSALAAQAALIRTRGASLLIVGAALWWLAFMLPFQRAIMPPVGYSFLRALVVAFWVSVALLVWLGVRSKAPRGESIGPREWIVYGLMVIVLTAAAYLPRHIELTRPDPVRRQIEAFGKIAPVEARVLTTIVPAERYFARTGAAAMNLGDRYHGQADDQSLKLAWLLQAGAEEMRGQSMPALFLDEGAWNNREQLFDGKLVGGLTSELYRYERVEIDGFRFYRMGPPADPQARRALGQLLEPYPAERIDGTRVLWTKLATWLRPNSRVRQMTIPYRVAHPLVSPDWPVVVEIYWNDRLLWRRLHTKKGRYGARVNSPASELPPNLLITVDRLWIDEKGRVLGIGLEPMTWEGEVALPE